MKNLVCSLVVGLFTLCGSMNAEACTSRELRPVLRAPVVITTRAVRGTVLVTRGTVRTAASVARGTVRTGVVVTRGVVRTGVRTVRGTARVLLCR